MNPAKVTDPSAYVGRFAPSPSGPLHQGSLVAALASWLDARAHGGRWLVRMEDVDRPRSVAGADRLILSQLAALGLEHDGDVWYQSRRDAAYQAAFHALADAGRVYPCACTRREIADSALPAASSSGERPYAGTCRQGLPAGRVPRAWRLRVPPGAVHVEDRWHGGLRQDVAREVGDFVLRRADGLWAYQLAVVVDDGAQKITHIVRGADLLGSTARQQVLQDALGLPRPVYLHVPLVLAEDGRKLSKQNGAPAIDVDAPLVSLRNAWEQLGFADFVREDVRSFLSEATARWARRWLPRPPR